MSEEAPGKGANDQGSNGGRMTGRAWLSSRVVLAAFIALVAIAPAILPPFYVTLFNYFGLYAMVALGLVLLTGIGGLTSFGQAAFVGLGAYTTAVLTSVAELPGWISWAAGSPWLALLLALMLTAATALFLGAITLKLSGHFLPLGTIAWGISLYYLFATIELLGGFTGLANIPPISVFGWKLDQNERIYYLIWLMLLVAVLAVGNLLDSREGRAIRALKGGRVMAEAMGVDTARSRRIIFLIAALLACVSGWLYAHMQRFVNPTPFGIHIGIEYLFMAVIGGAGHVWGALLGAGIVTVLKQWLQDLLPKLLGESGNFEVIVFGLLMALVLQKTPEGLWPWLTRRLPVRRPQRRPREKGDVADAGANVSTLQRRQMPAHGTTLLEVNELTRRFGGLVAVDRISLRAKAGEILAVIGPNGAGKSTLFNQISGVDTPTSGSIEFLGQSVVGRGSRSIARLGMSRTFQHVRLIPTMSVLENAAIGAHLRGSARVLRSAAHLERAQERGLLREAAQQLGRVGLGTQLDDLAGSLSLGQQRILEIARALCADPCLLLLDEPAAGLRWREKAVLAQLLRQLRDEGIGILLVEHDMEFLMGLVDRVVVIEFGRKIAEGSPQEVQRDPRVLEAYLGGVD